MLSEHVGYKVTMAGEDRDGGGGMSLNCLGPEVTHVTYSPLVRMNHMIST